MSKKTITGTEARRRLDFTDAQLLAECEVHTYRASGPGGQKRNKTSSAVRLHHGPTGLIVPAEESRSQHENKARALRRLREHIAVQFHTQPTDGFQWPLGVVTGNGVLRVGSKNPHLVHLLAVALDHLAAHHGQVKDAAARLGVSTSSLTRFLADHPKAWAEANRIRQQAGKPPLKAP